MTTAYSTLDDAQLLELRRIGERTLDELVGVFRENVGAPVAVQKGPGDYATTADLAIERQLVTVLAERTGMPAYGEEFGGAELDGGEPVWVIDPIDGTANYLHGIPLTAINLALVVNGEPVVGLTWLPLLDERYAAVAGGPALLNGTPIAPPAPTRLADCSVAIGNLTGGRNKRYPRDYRYAVLDLLVENCFRVRMLGSSAIDLAWSAAGRLGVSVNFGGFVWDNAPGLCLIRSAGRVATTVEGQPYDLKQHSIVAGHPGVVAELADLLARVDVV